jgi:hypothetical protein
MKKRKWYIRTLCVISYNIVIVLTVFSHTVAKSTFWDNIIIHFFIFTC